MSRQRESIFKDKVMARLASLPYSYWTKIEQRTTRGLPDIMGCICGFFVSIELKRSRSAAIDKLQVYTLYKIRHCGLGVSLVVWPENFDATLKFLKRISATKTLRALSDDIGECRERLLPDDLVEKKHKAHVMEGKK